MFAFVESVTDVGVGRDLYGPDGAPVEVPWLQGLGPVVEVRLSGIKRSMFLDKLGGFVDLSEGDPTSEQRKDRRSHFLQAFGDVRMPSLHFFYPGIADLFQSRWLFGQWLELEVDRLTSDWNGPVVHLDGPLEGGENDRTLALVSVLTPDLQTLARLRDIFSLVFVPDAELDDEGGSTDPDSPVPQSPLREHGRRLKKMERSDPDSPLVAGEGG